MGKGSSGSGNGPRDQEQYRNEQRNNQRGKYYYPKYIQEKLAITVLVITLALFALVMILYRIIKDNNEQYNKIVLSQRQQESHTGGEILWTGTAPIWLPARRCIT